MTRGTSQHSAPRRLRMAASVLPLPPWKTPRPVDRWIWLDIEVFDALGALIREGRVSWNQDGTGHYKVSITYQDHDGLGLYCWPEFRELDDAKAFVERLMDMGPEAAQAIHGTQWPGVVL